MMSADAKRIDDICNQLKLIPKLGIPKIYGYNNDLSCYEDIISIVKLSISNNALAKEYIGKLTTKKLRDIRAKIDSEGTIGVKEDMIQGITKKLPNLRMNYNVNVNSNKNKQKNTVNC